MTQRIIFKTDEGLAVIIPSDEALATRTIQEIADKDVPSGLPYKIVDVTDIPSDRTFRDAWDIADSELSDGVGADRETYEAQK
jgi:hypothetical protein